MLQLPDTFLSAHRFIDLFLAGTVTNAVFCAKISHATIHEDFHDMFFYFQQDEALPQQYCDLRQCRNCNLLNRWISRRSFAGDFSRTEIIFPNHELRLTMERTDFQIPTKMTLNVCQSFASCCQ